MKKLLVLALVANIAMAEDSFLADTTKDLGSEIEIGGQLAEIVTVPAQPIGEIKDASISIEPTVKDTSGNSVITETEEDSESLIEDVKDLASYFGEPFVDGFNATKGGLILAKDKVKDGFNTAIDGTKKLVQKVADSKFVTNVKGKARDANQVIVTTAKKATTKVVTTAKDANQVIVDTTKKTVTKVKDYVADSDAEEFVLQLAEAPGEFWHLISAPFKASKEKIG